MLYRSKEVCARLLHITHFVQCVRRIVSQGALEGMGDFKIEGRVIEAIKYADCYCCVQHNAWSASKKLRNYRTEINVSKSKVMRVYKEKIRQPKTREY